MRLSEKEIQRLRPTLRIRPDNWLRPLPLERWFDARPLDMDIGFGKGRFLLAHARLHPERQMLGIDRMLQRVRKVDHRAVRMGLENVRLLRVDALYAVKFLLPVAAFDTIFIFFPDPWPKARHHEHRFFNESFLNALHRILKPGGAMHFATDHTPYFEAVRALLMADVRFRETTPFIPSEETQTDFERYYIQHTRVGRYSVLKHA